MTPTQTFPRDLLDQPLPARLAYFCQKMIAHPKLVEADQALLSAIRTPGEAALIFVIGPSGVGKTTLRLHVHHTLIEGAQLEMTRDAGWLPVAGMEAVPPESRSFSWRDYYTRALIALQEPPELIRAKSIMNSDRNMAASPSGHPPLFGATCSVATLRQSLELCLSHRRPSAFFIDEAQHLKKVASGRRLLDQMDIIKSLASMTHTLHVLLGTYELIGMTNLSAQLGRRSIVIHFPRYRFDCAAELRAFKRVVLTFQQYLPVTVPPDWSNDIEYLYERSGGCVGTLKGWLNRALAAALEAGGQTVTRQHLERVIDSHGLLQMAREIEQGEADWEHNQADQPSVQTLLGMRSRPGTPVQPEERQHGADASRKPRKVGQRRATRDRVPDAHVEPHHDDA